MNKTILSFINKFIIILFICIFNTSCNKESETTLIPSSIEICSGNNQTAVIETSLKKIEVIVKDQNGNPFEKTDVKFEVIEGSVSAEIVKTDDNGKAGVIWTLGSTIGEQTLTITSLKPDKTSQISGSPIILTATATKLPIDYNYKILFLGHSFFGYNNLPDMFSKLCKALDKDVYVDQYVPGGTHLADHASNSITNKKINDLDWSHVVLIGSPNLIAYPQEFSNDKVYPALQKLHTKILNNNESTIPVLCMTWAYEDGMTWYNNWTQNYEDMQTEVYVNTLEYANELDFVVAPIGWSWEKVLKEKNYPIHYLHLPDYSHPSLKGSYLAACTIFSTIFQESSLGASYCGVPKINNATYLQEKASNTVLNNLSLWNIR